MNLHHGILVFRSTVHIMSYYIKAHMTRSYVKLAHVCLMCNSIPSITEKVV